MLISVGPPRTRLDCTARHCTKVVQRLSSLLKMHPTKLVDSDQAGRQRSSWSTAIKLVDSDPAVPDNSDLPKSSPSIPLNPGSDVLGDGSRDKPSRESYRQPVRPQAAPIYLSLPRPGNSLHLLQSRSFWGTNLRFKERNHEVILASLINLLVSVFKGRFVVI